MEKKMYVTYSDNLGLVRVEIDNDGIICDGTRLMFADANEKTYSVLVEHVFSISME